jgi:hypothetical protein
MDIMIRSVTPVNILQTHSYKPIFHNVRNQKWTNCN